MDEFKLEEWVKAEKEKVVTYLQEQGIDSLNMGDWPAFDAAPHFAIWAVESQKSSGSVGWWAFSGDCPTDYVSENGDCHPRSALKELLDRWKKYIPYLNKGENPPNVNFGSEENLTELARLLEKRIDILSAWHLNDELWEHI